MDIKTALGKVVDQLDLSTEEMQDVMRQIMTGQCTDAQIGGFLVALRMKSETLDEITGAALVMRELASGVRSTPSAWSTPAAPAVTAPTSSTCRPPPRWW